MTATKPERTPEEILRSQIASGQVHRSKYTGELLGSGQGVASCCKLNYSAGAFEAHLTAGGPCKPPGTILRTDGTPKLEERRNRHGAAVWYVRDTTTDTTDEWDDW